MKKKSKKCLDCDADLTGTHFNRKRCLACADKIATTQSRECIKNWKKKNPDKVKALNKSWGERFPIKKRLPHAREIARRRGYACTLTDEQFINYWNTPCHYCDSSILEEKGIGLDRLNNNLGYETSNVVPCCGDCNYIRGDILTHDEMKVAMNAVVKYRNGKEQPNT
jgi:hypothetical protein